VPKLAFVNHETMAASVPGDGQLLALVAKRDSAAFEQLVNRHYDVVYRVAWRMAREKRDAEDVVQETFLKLWRDPSQLREAGALKGWLIRVANNALLDRFRQRPMDDLDQAGEIADTAPNAEIELQQTQAERQVAASLQQLPERQRLALSLVYFEQMTNAAAAVIMEISVDAVESLLARARKSLKETLAEDKNELLASLTGRGH
jgi:RNA polymerase sigma-70 factor, ECF subfamily